MLLHDRSPRVLILTAHFGDGHRKVAQALCEELASAGAEAEVVDGFRETSRLAARCNEWIYEWSTRYAPWVYGASYQWTSNVHPEHPLWRTLALFSRRAVRTAVTRYQPDWVVQVFPDHALAGRWFRAAASPDEPLAVDVGGPSGQRPRLAVVLTDFAVHPHWFHQNVDVYFLPHESLIEPARRWQTPYAASVVTGIPLRRQFGEPQPIPLAHRPYVLVMTGGRGVFPGLEEAIAVIREALPGHAVYVMCGRNDRMYKRVQQAGEPLGGQVYPLPFVENVAAWLQHADLVVGKAGGVSVAEALACGCPQVVYRPQPGQEAENAAFIVRTGLGRTARHPRELKDALAELKQLGLRAGLGPACRAVGRPQAARAVVDHLFGMMQEPRA